MAQKISIIYSEEDNISLNNSKKWVTNFHRFVDSVVRQLDKNLEVVLLPIEQIQSPADVSSQKSNIIIMTEKILLHASAIDSINFHLQKLKEQNVSRFPYSIVTRYPFDFSKKNPLFKNFETHNFFVRNIKTGQIEDLTNPFEKEATSQYWLKILDICYEVLDLNDKSFDTNYANNKKNKNDSLRDRSVYLATTGFDVLNQRDDIKRELNRYGYKVYSTNLSNSNKDDMEQHIIDDLNQCCMSVHLIGADYGEIIKGTNLSQPDFQSKIVIEYTHKIKNYDKIFNKLVWVSPSVDHLSERQKLFLDELLSYNTENEHIEVLKIPLQDFKSVIKEELETKSRIYGGSFNIEEETKFHNQKKNIYLIYDKVDEDKVDKIKSELVDKFDILIPKFEGDFIEVRDAHYHNLKNCDNTIIFSDKISIEWIKAKVFDILKTPGFGRKKGIDTNILVYNSNNIDIENESEFFSKKNINCIKNDQDKEARLYNLLNKI